MHKSRLGGLIIDCRTDDLGGAAAFWGGALGLAALPVAPGDPNYVGFDNGPNGLDIEVQKVAHESRVHIDIETDDIEAEVARLEELGAKRIKRYPRWMVMEAPTGQRFCVVDIQTANFAEEANAWP
jgi:predicted enzyme related to lactoylglutathione lyase